MQNPHIEELLRRKVPPAIRNRAGAGDIAVFVTAVFGVLGAVLISDDYDFLRYTALGLAGVPFAILYASGRVLFPRWKLESPRAVRASATILVLLFSTGVVPLLNAIGSDGVRLKRTVPLGAGQSQRDVYRGGLGWVFTAPPWWAHVIAIKNAGESPAAITQKPPPPLTAKPVRRL